VAAIKQHVGRHQPHCCGLILVVHDLGHGGDGGFGVLLGSFASRLSGLPEPSLRPAFARTPPQPRSSVVCSISVSRGCFPKFFSWLAERATRICLSLAATLKLGAGKRPTLTFDLLLWGHCPAPLMFGCVGESKRFARASLRRSEPESEPDLYAFAGTVPVADTDLRYPEETPRGV
jgi:hypothetical protein